MRTDRILVTVCAVLLLLPACTKETVSNGGAILARMEVGINGEESSIKALYTFLAPPEGLYSYTDEQIRNVTIAVFKGIPPYAYKWSGYSDEDEFEPLGSALQIMDVTLRYKEGQWEIYRKLGDTDTKIDAIEVLVPDNGYYIDYRYVCPLGVIRRYSYTRIVSEGLQVLMIE